MHPLIEATQNLLDWVDSDNSTPFLLPAIGVIMLRAAVFSRNVKLAKIAVRKNLHWVYYCWGGDWDDFSETMEASEPQFVKVMVIAEIWHRPQEEGV